MSSNGSSPVVNPIIATAAQRELTHRTLGMVWLERRGGNEVARSSHCARGTAGLPRAAVHRQRCNLQAHTATTCKRQKPASAARTCHVVHIWWEKGLVLVVHVHTRVGPPSARKRGAKRCGEGPFTQVPSHHDTSAPVHPTVTSSKSAIAIPPSQASQTAAQSTGSRTAPQEGLGEGCAVVQSHAQLNQRGAGAQPHAVHALQAGSNTGPQRLSKG